MDCTENEDIARILPENGYMDIVFQVYVLRMNNIFYL